MTTSKTLEALEEWVPGPVAASIERHLTERSSAPSDRDGIGVVFDVTRWCNMSCRGCAVNALLCQDLIAVPDLGLSTAEIVQILKKLHDFTATLGGSSFFLNFGGGEPFLRPDFMEILEEACLLFGRDRLGVDTNGSLLSRNTLRRLGGLVSYIGVSVDGPAEYHNWWRRGIAMSAHTTPYDAAMAALEAAGEYAETHAALEVSTVATRHNLELIGSFIGDLRCLGIQRYSVHRPMPVGRFAAIEQLVPSTSDFLVLLGVLADASADGRIRAHLHHSLESVFAAVFLGAETYAGKVLGAPDKRSSIGIDPAGRVHFDPWCVVPPWDELGGPSLLDEGVTLDQLSDEGALSLAQDYCDPSVRCLGCPHDCSGGSRIAAAASYLNRSCIPQQEATLTQLLHGMTQIDPLCPLAHEDRMGTKAVCACAEGDDRAGS